MTDTHEQPEHPAPGPGGMQFSLRTLFIVTTGLAVTTSGVFAGPTWVSVVTAMVFTAAATIALTVVLIYGRGYQRTFCIGALFPSGLVTYQATGSLLALMWYGMGTGSGVTALGVAIFLMVYCLVVIAAGLLALGVRWMVESSRRESPAAFPAPVGSPFSESDDSPLT